MDKIPVMVRRWRDSNELVALFVQSPCSADAGKCWAYDTERSTFVCYPVQVCKRTVDVPKLDAEVFLSRINQPHYKQDIGESLSVKYELHQRDRVIENLNVRRDRWDTAHLKAQQGEQHGK